MTDKEFVLSIIPDAYSEDWEKQIKLTYPEWVIRSHTISERLAVGGFDTVLAVNINEELAWTAAAERIKEVMISQLEEA